MHSRHSSGSAPAPPTQLPQPQNRAPAAAHGERLSWLGPSPALPYLLLRAPGEAARGVWGRGRLHPAAGRAAGAAPLASPRGQPQGGGMAATLPAVHRAQGEGKGNEVNRILRQEAFQGLPSAAAPRSYLQPAPELRLRSPPALSPGRHKGKLRCFPRCPGTGINKCSPWPRRGRARLSRRGAEGSGLGPGSSTVSWSPALQLGAAPSPGPLRHPLPTVVGPFRQLPGPPAGRTGTAVRATEKRGAESTGQPGRAPAASQASPSSAGSSGPRGGCSSSPRV